MIVFFYEVHLNCIRSSKTGFYIYDFFACCKYLMFKSFLYTLCTAAPPPMIESIQPEQGPFTMLPGSSMPFSFTCTGISFLVISSRATLMWTGPDDVSVNTLPRAQQTLTIFNDSILQNTLNLTGALVQDSGRYECTVSNQCGEDARSIDVTFEGMLGFTTVYLCRDLQMAGEQFDQ